MPTCANLALEREQQTLFDILTFEALSLTSVRFFSATLIRKSLKIPFEFEVVFVVKLRSRLHNILGPTVTTRTCSGGTHTPGFLTII